MEARRSEVLPTPYFHAVFTIPEELNVLAIHAPTVVYAILLRAAGRALVDVAQTKLRATLGLTAKDMVRHLMTVATRVRLDFLSRRDYTEHYAAKTTTLTATEFLRRFAMHIVPPRFVRIRYFGFLANRVRSHNIVLARELIASKLRPSEPRPLLRLSCRTDWHSYVKKPLGVPDQVLAYLSSYTHRIAISNRRIIAFDGESVTFTWECTGRRGRRWT